ncbi:MAG: hypothetical protein SCM96_07285 [Acidobacteriota bacterium]|nr:hypothetical protein [Acidobacteriota bacterium]
MTSMDRNRFGRFGWGLNSVEFSFGEGGMADGFRATGGRVRNHRFLRLMPVLDASRAFPYVPRSSRLRPLERQKKFCLHLALAYL